MTATTETVIFSAILSSIGTSVPGCDVSEWRVVAKDKSKTPEHRIEELQDWFLPPDFNNLKLHGQVAHCIEYMILWAKERNQCAAILVIVPGEKEMEQVITEWANLAQKNLPLFSVSVGYFQRLLHTFAR